MLPTPDLIGFCKKFNIRPKKAHAKNSSYCFREGDKFSLLIL